MTDHGWCVLVSGITEMLIFTTTGPYPLAMVATPLFLLALIVFFVFQAFSDSVGDGIRSFAAVLLPLMTIALLVGFRRDELREKKEALQEGSAQAFPSALAFTLTLLAGIGVLALLVITPTGVPLPELVLSGCFSVLIYSYVALPQDKAMFYYFGMVLSPLCRHSGVPDAEDLKAGGL